MDTTDRATDLEEDQRQAALDAVRLMHPTYSGTSATHCELCSDSIPEARQRVLPGVSLCVPCQSDQERICH